MQESFQSMFMKTKGKPILYQGKQLVMIDSFPVNDSSAIVITFESTKSDWKQAINFISIGDVELNNNRYNGKNTFILWEDTAPKQSTVYLHSTIDIIKFYNAWDMGTGATEAWHNCAAMIVEEIENGRRYHCNDGFADDDFDDLVFRVERLSTTS